MKTSPVMAMVVAMLASQSSFSALSIGQTNQVHGPSEQKITIPYSIPGVSYAGTEAITVKSSALTDKVTGVSQVIYTCAPNILLSASEYNKFKPKEDTLAMERGHRTEHHSRMRGTAVSLGFAEVSVFNRQLSCSYTDPNDNAKIVITKEPGISNYTVISIPETKCTFDKTNPTVTCEGNEQSNTDSTGTQSITKGYGNFTIERTGGHTFTFEPQLYYAPHHVSASCTGLEIVEGGIQAKCSVNAGFGDVTATVIMKFGQKYGNVEVPDIDGNSCTTSGLEATCPTKCTYEATAFASASQKCTPSQN